MDAFVIEGGTPLRGRVRVRGSKNAALPLMAAALLTDEPVVLRDVPDLSDIRNMSRLLRSLGCQADRSGDADADDRGEGAMTLAVTDASGDLAHYDIVRTMRAGICVLGPLLARRGGARVSMPGGCAIGDRPVDLHLRGLAALGARIHLDGGYIVAEAPGGRLRGGPVFLGGPNGSTVLGTANVMSAAALAEGTTVIESAACEPEIADLAALLNTMGADVRGAGSPRLVIRGVEALRGAEHRVMPDRIEAGTYAIAAAITQGQVVLDNFPTDALTAVLDRLGAIGVRLVAHADAEAPRSGEAPAGPTAGPRVGPEGQTVPGEAPPGIAPLRERVRVEAPGAIEPVQIVTQPHPGFPTDLQAQFMSLLCLARGNSIVTEKIFPDRFLHVAELLRMGANLIRTGPTVVCTGVDGLIGAPVMASDLRASAGLVLAGLAARGATTVNRVYHLDRGYQRMETTLQRLGAKISRVEGGSV